jgi:hypothetical protein
MKKPARRSVTPPAAAKLDPHLTALLSYITFGATEDEDGRVARGFGRAMAAADQLLTSEPQTSAFQLWRNRPSLNELVADAIAADLESWTDPRDSRRAFEAVDHVFPSLRAMVEHEGDEIEATAFTESGFLVGFAVSWLLMTTVNDGGAR